MPLHDWTKAEEGNYHGFHQLWIAAIANALNVAVLPPDHYALVEKNLGDSEPDILTLTDNGSQGMGSGHESGIALMTAPPLTKVREVATETERYAARANRIAVRHRDKTIVAIVEIVSPGNKSNRNSFDKFVGKSVAWIERGIHLLVIDPFPPSRRDPLGMHRAIWDYFADDSKFKPTARKNRSLISYDAGSPVTAHVEPLGVGDVLPKMPLFLRPRKYVNLPLEKTYLETWNVFPKSVRREVE